MTKKNVTRSEVANMYAAHPSTTVGYADFIEALDIFEEGIAQMNFTLHGYKLQDNVMPGAMPLVLAELEHGVFGKTEHQITQLLTLKRDFMRATVRQWNTKIIQPILDVFEKKGSQSDVFYSDLHFMLSGQISRDMRNTKAFTFGFDVLCEALRGRGVWVHS